MNAYDPVPTFYLYGEPHRSAADNFVHVEGMVDRSQPADWTIRPHSHRDLSHLILIAEGGGKMQVEGEVIECEAPCMIVVPAGTVHGFRWLMDSTGSIITLAKTYWDELVRRDPDIATLGERPGVAALTREATRAIAVQVKVLATELAWDAPGRRTAVDAALAAIHVQAARAFLVHSEAFEPKRGRHAELVARFRALVEERFRDREPIGRYVAELGTSPTTLRTACLRVTGMPPAQLLNLRAMLQAKRSLCYTNQTIAEIAYSLGFSDPAYFTRSFTRYAGVPPRRYRQQQSTP